MSLFAWGGMLRWLIVGVGYWLAYQLFRQNGRIIMRLEALEAQLAQQRAAPRTAPRAPGGLARGSAAPAFNLPDLNGDHMALEQLRGQQVLLIFFNPNCGYCRNMAPDLAALPVDGRDGRPLPVVITTGDAEANRTLMAEHGVRCPVLLQQQTEVSSLYRASGTPMGYLIDEYGAIASELAVGAQAVLALATPVPAQANRTEGTEGNAHHGNRSLANSRINRSGLPAGTPAPNFRLPRLDGGTLALEEYRGRRVLLVLSDPNCGPCNELACELERLHRRMPDVSVLMVSRGDPEANRVKVAEHQLTFPVVLQRQWEISRDYGIFATPVGYLIDEEGRIAADVAVGKEPILALVSDRVVRVNGKEELQIS